MSVIPDLFKQSIVQFCAKIGQNPLLVQGAGGNVSWKDADTLWIKASGTWLADAMQKDIFVPVDLLHLQHALNNNDFSVTPNVCGESKLRPSIETLLHTLMPHRVVVHLHAIEILAHLVQIGWQNDFRKRLNPMINWVAVDYHKPGADLAQAISIALQSASAPNVVFLENHGVVIGGDTINDIEHLLNNMIDTVKIKPYSHLARGINLQSINLDEQHCYLPVSDPEIHQLATEEQLFKRLQSDWALCPDHVVFLGAEPYIYENWASLIKKLNHSHQKPELIFIQDQGVFTLANFGLAKNAQLRCYYDILVRQDENHIVKTLSPQQIGELLNWDAEHYRMGMAK